MAVLNLKRGGGFSAAAVAPTPQPEAKILPPDKSTAALVESEVLRTNAIEAVENAVLDARVPEPEYIAPEDVPDGPESPKHKLSQLVADDFPFDESQLTAIYGIAEQRYACLMGAAGTGKTTCTKKVVDVIQSTTGLVDMSNYWKRMSEDERADQNAGVDPDDDYEMPESAIPSIVLCSFTGRATQMVKKNFPRDWHGNIMTIHRLLAYMPEYYEEYDEGSGEMKNKMRFIPTYNAENKLPWDVIIIDEAGMLGLELWHNLFAALKDGCRIIMIGDINQLPPVHGRSIFGFALGMWPSWELTHIHRQQGVNNSIVDNAWRIINGQTPISDLANKSHEVKTMPGLVASVNAMIKEDWKFAMIKLPEEIPLAAQRVQQLLQVLQSKTKIYDPIRDTVITAINGHDESHGRQLGQIPLNQALAPIFNKDSDRYVIDAGRERKYFAVGDKVMATRNDHEAGITNGMTGVIESIIQNAAYTGDFNRFGLMSDVQEYLADDSHGEDDGSDFSLEELADTHAAQEDGREKAKESRERGPASHIVTVRFGEGDHSFVLPFGSLAEVASLMTAYVVTCHKMQGGESPLVIVICHQAHKQMLYREWAYTADTRASQRCLFLYTDLAIRTALTKQRIKGKTMREKIRAYQELLKVGLLGPSVNVKIQAPVDMDGNPWVPPVDEDAINKQIATAPSPLLQQLMASKATGSFKFGDAKPQPEPVRERVIERVVERTIIREVPEQKPAPKWGGTIKPESKPEPEQPRVFNGATVAQIAMVKALPAPVNHWTPERLAAAAERWHSEYRSQPLMLTHQPQPDIVMPEVPKVKTYKGLAALLNKAK